MTIIKNQLPRKEIKARQRELGLESLVASAIAGNQLAVQQLSGFAKSDASVRAALELLQPRRNPKNQKRREQVSAVERAGMESAGKITFVQGGSPGLKKRK